MKITTVEITQTKQVRQYEPLVISVSATLDKNDKLDDVVDDIKLYVNYSLNKEQREAMFEKYSNDLEKEKSPEKRKSIELWIEKYHELEDRMIKLEFK